MSAFKVFYLHAGHCDSSAFFPLKKHTAIQFWQNRYSHCNTFIGFFNFCVVSIIQLHPGRISSGFIWEERKVKKLWIQVESFTLSFGLPFRAVFTLSILLPIIFFWSSWTLSNFTFFSMSSPVVERWCPYSTTLLFDGSSHDRITLVADISRVYLWWIVTRYIYS